MAVRSFRIRLLDIREEIAGIRGLTKDSNAEAFAANWAMKRAVQHALLIIVEAAKHIPAELKSAHPEVPWQKIHGLGNMLRHEYRRIDSDVLWSDRGCSVHPVFPVPSVFRRANEMQNSGRIAPREREGVFNS